MKNLLLIIGIVGICISVLSFLYATLNRIGYYNLLDGEGDMYSRMHKRMTVFSTIGIVFAVVGAVCIIIMLKCQ